MSFSLSIDAVLVSVRHLEVGGKKFDGAGLVGNRLSFCDGLLTISLISDLVCRYAVQLLTPANLLARINGRFYSADHASMVGFTVLTTSQW